MVSGSSVTSGRCWALADETHPTSTAATRRAIHTRLIHYPPLLLTLPRTPGSPVRLRDGKPPASQAPKRQRYGAAGQRGLVQFGKRVQPAIEEMPPGDVAEGANHRVLDVGV